MNINIGIPCSEDWNKMLPNSTGKHCEKCNKSVVDIRNKTNTEIRELVALNEKSSMCIRAYSSQLSDYQYVHPIKRLAFALLIVFGSTLFNLSVKAQEASQKIKETYLSENKQTSNTIIKGTVLDKDGEALPFVNVILIENDSVINGITTDFDGKYTLNLDENFLNKEFTIRVSYISYETVVKTGVFIKKGVITLDFTLNDNYQLMGELYILPQKPLLENNDPSNANKTTFKRQEIQRSASGR